MRWPILIIAAALAGCAGSPWAESESQRRAEEAKNIPPIDYRADAIAFLRTYLNDPTRIRNAAISQPELKTVGPITRFVACVRFNAKKSNGQYAGLKDNAAVFISGKLDRLIELGGTGEESERNKPLREFCASAAYEPFPELERMTR